MQRFRGHSEHSLDPKGRLSIPARFRDVLRDEYSSDTLIVTHWMKCLKAYPVPVWEQAEEKMIQRLEEGNVEPKFARLVRYLIAGVNECPLDRQGRILLPPALREEIGLTKEVMLNGMLKNFEIWDKGAWQEEALSAQEAFEEFNDGLAMLGMI